MCRAIKIVVGGICAMVCVAGCEMLDIYPDISLVPPGDAMPIDGEWWETGNIKGRQSLRMIRIEKGRAYVVRDVQGGTLSNRVIATSIKRIGPGQYTWNHRAVDGVAVSGYMHSRFAARRQRSATTGEISGIGVVLQWESGANTQTTPLGTPLEMSIRLHPVQIKGHRFFDSPQALVKEIADTPNATADDLAAAAILARDKTQLEKIALSDADCELRRTVIQRIFDESVLVRIALAEKNFEIKKFVLDKIRTPVHLSTIERDTKDEAIRLAMKVRLGKTTWKDAIGDATQNDAKIATVIGAVALSNENLEPLACQIVALCHSYIRRGDSNRIPELKEMLQKYGDKSLAEDYLNCGQLDLEEAGKQWGIAHRYSIRQGHGSNRVRWGEGSQ